MIRNPMRMRRLGRIAAIGVALNVALVACGGGGVERAEGGRASITVATVATESCAQSFIARDKGLFTKHNLDVNLKVVAGVPELAAAVSSGSAHVACTAPTATASAHVKGLGFKIVAPGVQYTKEAPSTYLMVPTNSPITSVQQLAGKTIAVNALNTLPHLSTMATLQDAGVDPKSVRFVKLDFPNIGQALDSGQVAAGVTQTPYTQDNERSGVARSLVSPYDAVNKTNPFIYTIWFSKADLIADDPEVVTRFHDAIVESSQWANDPANAEGVRTILQTATGVPRHALVGHNLTKYGTSLTPELLQPNFDLMVRFGALRQPVAAPDLIGRPAAAP